MRLSKSLIPVPGIVFRVSGSTTCVSITHKILDLFFMRDALHEHCMTHPRLRSWRDGWFGGSFQFRDLSRFLGCFRLAHIDEAAFKEAPHVATAQPTQFTRPKARGVSLSLRRMVQGKPSMKNDRAKLGSARIFFSLFPLGTYV